MWKGETFLFFCRPLALLPHFSQFPGTSLISRDSYGPVAKERYSSRWVVLFFSRQLWVVLSLTKCKLKNVTTLKTHVKGTVKGGRIFLFKMLFGELVTYLLAVTLPVCLSGGLAPGHTFPQLLRIMSSRLTHTGTVNCSGPMTESRGLTDLCMWC